MKNDWQKAIDVLNNDGVVILPTDTLYGIVGKALSKKTVENIYKIKGRNEDKPFIILITSFKDLGIFGVEIEKNDIKVLKEFWPGKVSIVLPCNLSKFEYLHRGTNSIAFRMIGSKNQYLYKLLKKVGPIVAPSANPEGFVPAKTIDEALKYFNNKVDLYVAGGKRDVLPSKLIKYEKGEFVVLRK